MNRKLIVLLVLVAVGAGVWAIASRDTNSSSSTTTTTDANREQITADMAYSEVISVDPQFARFEELLLLSKVDAEIDSDPDHTILAPSSEAFDRAGSEVTSLVDDPTGALATVLKRHILTERLDIAELTALDGKTVEALSGENLPVTVTDGVVSIGGVKIAKSDIQTKEAVIDVLDGVIPAPAPSG